MVRYVVIHAAYFLFLFLHGLLAVPLKDKNLESAPLFFCRRCTSHNNKTERRCGNEEVYWRNSLLNRFGAYGS